MLRQVGETRRFQEISIEDSKDGQWGQCEQSGGIMRLFLDTQTYSELNSSTVCVPAGPCASMGRGTGSGAFFSSPGLAGT